MAATTRKKPPEAAPAPENASGAAGFSLAQVFELLHVAKGLGVKTLQIGQLSVSFKESPKKISGPRPDAQSQAAPQVTRAAAEQEAKAGRTQERDELAADELARLQIEDPLAYEKYLTSEDADDSFD